MASAFVVGYSVGGMFPSYLQKDLGLPTGYVALPIMLQSLMFFLSAMLWGWCADRFGRRITLMMVTIPIAPLYLLTTDYTMIVAFFTLQGFFGGGGMHTQWPHYLSERFPTEVRATATGFCYHQGAIFGGLVGPVLSYFATELAHGICDTDDDRHHRRRRLGFRLDAVQPRDEGHKDGFGYSADVTRYQMEGWLVSTDGKVSFSHSSLSRLVSLGTAKWLSPPVVAYIRSAAGMVVDQDCAKSCQTVLPIPCADGHTPGATALGLLSPSHSLAHFAAVSLI